MNHLTYDLHADYQFGYTPAKIICGDSILHKIDYNNLSVIGAGCNSLTITDDTYAIKIGYIDDYDISAIKKASECGFSVPVYYHDRNTDIDSRFIHFIQKNRIYRFGMPIDIEEYIQNGCADIAVLGLAEPFAKHNAYRDTRSKPAEKKLLEKLNQAFIKASGMDIWSDQHIFQIGFYHGGLVILDF